MPIMATTKIICPSTLPSAPVQLSKTDAEMMGWGGTAAVNVLQGKLDLHRMEAALRTLVEANPILAGRLQKDESSPSGLVVSFPPQNCGVEFSLKAMEPEHEKTLFAVSADKIVKYESSHAELCRPSYRAALNSVAAPVPPGNASVGVISQPLAMLSIAQAMSQTDFFTLTFSVSHMLADGWSYFELLRLLELEYNNPGAADLTLPSERACVDAVRESRVAAKSTFTDFKHRLWFPTLFFARAFWRKPETRCSVSMILTDAQLATIKTEALKAAPDRSDMLSTNDALTAWIANVCGAVGFSYACNLRGKVDALPRNLLANAALGDGMVGTSSNRLCATDVRNSVKMQGCASGPGLFQLYARRVYGFTNWTKVQYIPSFGTRNLLHQSMADDGSLQMLKLLDFGVINKIAPETTRVSLFLAKSDVLKLRAACEAFGFYQNLQTLEVPEGTPEFPKPSRWSLLKDVASKSLSLLRATICSTRKRVTATKNLQKVRASLMPRLLACRTNADVRVKGMKPVKGT